MQKKENVWIQFSPKFETAQSSINIAIQIWKLSWKVYRLYSLPISPSSLIYQFDNLSSFSHAYFSLVRNKHILSVKHFHIFFSYENVLFNTIYIFKERDMMTYPLYLTIKPNTVTKQCLTRVALEWGGRKIYTCDMHMLAVI